MIDDPHNQDNDIINDNIYIHMSSKVEDAPMCFDIKESVTDCKIITVSCSDTDGNVCIEELPVFTKNSPSKSLIQLLKEVLIMQERFEWLVEGSVNDDDANKKKTLIFQHFRRPLKGLPQRK